MDGVIIDDESGCWNWVKASFKGGYGRISISGKICAAHRVSYTLSHGEIGEDLCVLHKCDNPRCINPDHLFVGTQMENMLDKCKKGRHRNGRNDPAPVEQTR